MNGTIEVRIDLPSSVVSSIVKPMELEAGSAPPGGRLNVATPGDGGIVMKMASEDISTLRAMLNSYLGLASAAVKAAQ
jgi:tRNA threonylcarbamoyladenosine modification (KEOPS) complex  Pcc1 subunit